MRKTDLATILTVMPSTDHPPNGGCAAVSDFPAASIHNVNGTQPIERQLYGAATVIIFLRPVSCHPGAPALGRQEPTATWNLTP